MIKNLLSFKIKYKIIFNFCRGHFGPLHKIQGYQGHRNVSKGSSHHNGDICTTRGNNLKTSFSYMSQNVIKMYILGYLGGTEGVFNNQTGPILLSSYPLTQNMEKKKSYLGGVLGGAYVQPR